MVLQVEKIGQILIDAGLITSNDLSSALKQQIKNNLPLGKILLAKNLIDEVQLAQALAIQRDLPFVRLEYFDIYPHIASLIPENVCRKYGILPLEITDSSLILAMSYPLNVNAIDDVKVITNLQVEPVVATESDIQNSINRFWTNDKNVQDSLDYAIAKAEENKEESILDLKQATEEAPIINLTNKIIAQAVDQNASDIHIEPNEKSFRIRFRVDGVLREVMTVPKKIQSGFVSRLKIMSDLNIAEHRLPQDGRSSLIVDNKEIDLRLSTLPTPSGESVVIRILDKSGVFLQIDKLGLSTDLQELFKKEIAKPYGTILITGPTGSGKTTTLYAALDELNRPKVKIITLEDPVEYRFSGIVQIQINTRIGLSFSRGLRSIVRADPDIIMVGEIRDKETGNIALTSALTGHLVLSSLHTNDAAGAFPRLSDMGIEPFIISSGIDAVVAQRLARKLCAKCKTEIIVDKAIANKSRNILSIGDKIFTAKGCRKCFNSGYSGRTGVYEILKVTPEIHKLITKNANAEKINIVALDQGMKPLFKNGIEKVKIGITSLEEILRVVT